MSRRAFPELPRHNLKAVTTHLRIPLRHHDALSDARACAIIAHQCMVRGAGA
jgi:DNA polymerase-3 subunit epsilon